MIATESTEITEKYFSVPSVISVALSNPRDKFLDFTK